MHRVCVIQKLKLHNAEEGFERVIMLYANSGIMRGVSNWANSGY